MSTFPLRRDQIERYARHILLPDVGGIGQARLLAASVAVPVGPGRGHENAALVYLAAAGVGRLIVTGDPHGPVSPAEIRDSILFGLADLGRPRIDAIAERIHAINPDVAVVAVAGSGEAAFPLAPLPELGNGAIGLPGLLAGRPEEAVADALLAGGLRAARTLFQIVSHEPA